jgi:cyclic lactone autoinducer peptide
MEGLTAKTNKLSKTALLVFATSAIMLAKLLTQSASLLFWGEPKCPKSLLK